MREAYLTAYVGGFPVIGITDEVPGKARELAAERGINCRASFLNCQTKLACLCKNLWMS